MQDQQNTWIQSIERYRRFRGQVDEHIAHLGAIHGEHLACRPGCCSCCVNLTVFAVELYAIAGQLAEAGIGEVAFDLRATCGWLDKGLCRIYAARPIICRTHGLPVAIPNDDCPEHKEVSFCPLNFTGADPEAYAFGPDNTLDLAELNEELCRINADFIEAARKDGVELPVRIELARLVDLLGQMK
jgi:Fe-S-cluster containining protein